MKRFLFALLLTTWHFMLIGQIAYEYAENKNISFGSYGRIGVDWSFENGGSIGRRLNLNNMGSTGGRLEEQDYFEIASAMRFPSFKKEDSTRVFIQTRLSVYSNSLSLIGNSTSSSLGGLTFALPEMFVEARNIAGSGVNFWVGARLYRGPDIHIADYRYFNDHSGQGFGLELKNTRFVGLYVASTDTNATVPPYFYLNIATGTPSIALRQRSVWSIEQDIDIANNNKLTLLAEYHYMGNADADSDTLMEYNYPSDYGFVGGVRFESNFQAIKNSFNRFSARYGNRIANGGDGGLSRTWMTFGAPDTISRNFHGAYSFSITDEVLLELSNKYSLNAYLIYTQSKGAAPDNGLSKTYWGREVYNRKEDFVIGTRNVFYLTDKFRLIGEAHFAQRKDGDNAMAKMLKLSFAPAFVPTGNRNYWARPEFRFISSFAFYNQYAQDNLYSPYLEFVGSKKIGYFLGIKVEWWIWN